MAVRFMYLLGYSIFFINWNRKLWSEQAMLSFFSEPPYRSIDWFNEKKKNVKKQNLKGFCPRQTYVSYWRSDTGIKFRSFCCYTLLNDVRFNAALPWIKFYCIFWYVGSNNWICLVAWAKCWANAHAEKKLLNGF